MARMTWQQVAAKQRAEKLAAEIAADRLLHTSRGEIIYGHRWMTPEAAAAAAAEQAEAEAASLARRAEAAARSAERAEASRQVDARHIEAGDVLRNGRWITAEEDKRHDVELAMGRQWLAQERVTVLADCGHQVSRLALMSASRGTSCPDCYDRRS